MLGERLQSIGSEIRIVALTRNHEATQQMVELLLVDLLLRALGKDAASADVIEIIEVLRCVALYFIGVDGLQSLNRLPLKTDIIIIGGVDDGVLRLGIEHAVAVFVGEQFALFVDTVQHTVSLFTVFMELTVAGPALTEAHLLNITDE